MIQISCSKCGRKFKIADKYAGKAFTCKQCGSSITIPQSKEQDINSFDTSHDPYDMFMKKNFETLQAMLKHEKEAPAMEVQ